MGRMLVIIGGYMSCSKEEWKMYDDRVEISNRGRVRRYIMPKGNMYRAFRSNGQAIRVHEAVMSLFGPSKPDIDCKMHIHHKDGDRTNNNLSNLEWISQHKHLSKLKDGEIWLMKKLHANSIGPYSLAKIFCIPVSSVYSIVKGKSRNDIIYSV
jgi:hypothetical protein